MPYTKWSTIKCILIFTLGILIIQSCNRDNSNPIFDNSMSKNYISACDISSLPEIELSNNVYFDENGLQVDLLNLLRENGINTIRLRLWVNPDGPHSSFEEVISFSERLKALDFKIWLNLHFSDSWADPGQQVTPSSWTNLSTNTLKDSVYNYTARVTKSISPHIIQLGNEINPGFLHPTGHIDQEDEFIALLDQGIQAVRDISPSSKIMIHYAGYDGALSFYSRLDNLDYDLIGLSYYPIWHGRSLQTLESTITQLINRQDKEVIIAETSYPFTLDWNDMTHNNVGLDEHLILPDFPATPEGQAAFYNKLNNMARDIPNLLGYSYWGGELVAWKGNKATDGSHWENQALFDFDNKALPVIKELGF